MKTIRIHPRDNVAVALSDLNTGEYGARESIPRGHKIALCDISEGDSITKYGCTIGYAKTPILKGSWVHTHNVRTGLSESAEYTYRPDTLFQQGFSSTRNSDTLDAFSGTAPRTFRGYRRADGRAAIRNELWIIPLVGCVNTTAQQLVLQNQHLVGGSVEGLYTFSHPFGCSQMGDDHANTRKILADLVRHPNAGGVLVLGLGCENLTMEQFKEELGQWDDHRVKFLICQDSYDEIEEGSLLLTELAQYASQFQREEIPASELIVGMKCGGSDGLSGITANPAVGRFSDRLISLGGTTILTEVPEMFGAESILLNRCKDRATFDRAVAMIEDFKDYFIGHGQVVYENPSPGNKEGGITTLEDKSCGCVQKGGSAPVMDILNYGDRVTNPGLNLLSGPGNDLVSCTALTSAGAHLILFTTGRGPPFGAPVPTVKISTNNVLAEKKPAWIDFNAGTAAESRTRDGQTGPAESLDDCGDRLLDYVLEVASGRKTNNERRGAREISIFKDGVVL
ncbi:MAG: altronate dehydratase [Firmicutes bacterium]|nr:altronate dehydratase [Bacillota bacterium]